MNRPSCDAYFQRFFFEGETKAFDRIGFLCACDYFEKRKKKDIRNGGLITGVFSSIQIVIFVFDFWFLYPLPKYYNKEWWSFVGALLV